MEEVASNDTEASGERRTIQFVPLDSTERPTTSRTESNEDSGVSPSKRPKFDEDSCSSDSAFGGKVSQEVEKTVNDSLDDGDICMICYGPFVAEAEPGNDHRIAALKNCGHVFGRKCIETWFRQCGPKLTSCPICKKKAKARDVLLVFLSGKRVQIQDNTEMVKAQRERDDCKAKLVEMEKELNELRKLKAQQLHANFASTSSSSAGLSLPLQQSSHAPRRDSMVSQLYFRKLKQLELIADRDPGKHLRVAAFSSGLRRLVCSVPSSNTLYPGYGLKKIELPIGELRSGAYIPIHSAEIRDIKWSPSNDGFLLTGSNDRKLKMCSWFAGQVSHSIDVGDQVSSCAFNQMDENYVYAGTTRGRILGFDLRAIASNSDGISNPVLELNFLSSKTPVTALHWLTAVPGTCSAGLLAGTLTGLGFFATKSSSVNEFTQHTLGLDGNLVSLSFNEVLNRCLASFRGTQKYPRNRHVTFKLAEDFGSSGPFCVTENFGTIQGGQAMKIMSRSSLAAMPGGAGGLVCFYDEDCKEVLLYDLESGNKIPLIGSDSLRFVGDVYEVLLAPISDSTLQLFVLESKRLTSFLISAERI